MTIEKEGKRSRIDQKRGLGIYLDILRFKHPSFQSQYRHFYKVVEGLEKPKLTIDEEIAMIGMMGKVVEYLSRSKL